MNLNLRLKPSIVLAAIALCCATSVTAVFAADPLPSWNEGKTKSQIIHFVEEVTKANGPNFVPPPERIATFDNDGTLMLEQPNYVQLLFALDRIKEYAQNHPELKTTEPFKSVMAGDISPLLASGYKAVTGLMLTTDSGVTVDEFQKIVKQWLATTEDTRFKRHHQQLVYQPMLELLTYLRSNGFKTYIVTGSGIEFIRAFSEQAYGIPPEQVVGSSLKTKYEYRNGQPAIVRLPELNFIDDKDGKPLGIQEFIGRHPVCAFGNSDGDLQMLQWADAHPGPHFCLYVHHTDATREYAYDRHSKIGMLDKGLDEAAQHGWTVVDMKNDWKTIFPPELFPAKTK